MTNSVKYSIKYDPIKGRCLIANQTIQMNEIIFEEKPLISSQFLWNKQCKYDACQYCLQPLETAEENVTRLTNTNDKSIKLPYIEQCCQTNKLKHVNCSNCNSERYCSVECKNEAYEQYHKIICYFNNKNKNLIQQLCDLWKSIHYPPETASIMLLVKIFVRIKLDPIKFIEKLKQFYNQISTTNEQKEKIFHKLCGDKFIEQLQIIRNIFIEIFSNDEDELLKPYLSENGFNTLMAIIAQNGQGIGTSAFSTWAKNCENFLNNNSNNPNELKSLNEMIDKLFEKMDQVSGCQFLNNEGSGLYELQSCINHSCKPNSEVCFPHNNFILSVKAIETINVGEEITICYLDECWRNRSRHSRMKYLQENYLFNCKCQLCQQQQNDPDVTSSDEDDDDDEEFQSDPDDDDEMNCD